MRILFFVMATLALVECGPASGQPIAPPPPPNAAESPEHELATRFLRASGGEEQFLRTAVLSFRLGLEARGFSASEDQWARAGAVVRESLQESARIYVAEVATFLAASNSRDDIEQALAFYQTPSGAALVRATEDVLTPFMLYLMFPAAPAPSAPDVSTVDPARLTAAEQLATIYVNRIGALSAETISLRGYSLDQLRTYLSAALAARLTKAELLDALAWARSPAADRIEGASAARNEAIQLATLRATRAARYESWVPTVVTILTAETPT